MNADDCPHCNGNGTYLGTDFSEVECALCGGTGVKPKWVKPERDSDEIAFMEIDGVRWCPRAERECPHPTTCDDIGCPIVRINFTERLDEPLPDDEYSEPVEGTVSLDQWRTPPADLSQYADVVRENVQALAAAAGIPRSLRDMLGQQQTDTDLFYVKAAERVALTSPWQVSEVSKAIRLLTDAGVPLHAAVGILESGGMKEYANIVGPVQLAETVAKLLGSSPAPDDLAARIAESGRNFADALEATGPEAMKERDRKHMREVVSRQRAQQRKRKGGRR